MKIRHVVIAALWIACSYLDYGYTLGSFTAAYPYMDHMGEALLMTTGGPFSLPAVLMGGSYDMHLVWRTTPLTYDERLAIFLKTYPILGKDYFDARYR